MTNKSHSANSIGGMQYRPYSHIVFALIAIAMLSYPACVYSADSMADSGQSMFSFSGFGTLGVIHSSEDDADYTASPLAPNGAGFTHEWSPDIDSRLGAQVTAHFTPQLSAMLQVISEQNYAYLTYATKSESNTFDPGLNVSALPPYLVGAALGLNAGLNALLQRTPFRIRYPSALAGTS